MQAGAEELVFVVERQDVFGGHWPQSFLPLEPPDAAALLERFASCGRFVPRAEAEHEPAWKQLIPYCVLRRPGAVFCVERRPAQGERRLHGKLSIGIGGHVNPVPGGPSGGSPGAGPIPAAAAGIFELALRRELGEELHGVDGRTPPALFRGLCNDDGDTVGQVHAGLVYTIDWPATDGDAPEPRVREISKMMGGFRSLAELLPMWQDPHRFESWSRTLIQAGVAGAMAVSRPQRYPVSWTAAERTTDDEPKEPYAPHP